MWAAASFQPPTTTRPPPRRRSIVVNNSTRNREVKMGVDDLGLAQAVIKTKYSKQNLDTAKTGIPSGADVLKALERAAAQKAMSKKEKKRMETKKGENQGSPCNFDNVRPLCVKPEWGDRLEDLERRLEQCSQPM